MNDKITVCLGKGGQREMAESFARKNNVPIMDKPGEHLTVMFDSRGVSLTGYGLTYQGDFEGMLHRVTNGRLSHEMLVRAVKTEGEHLKAIDATAGMGEDGFLLAAYGYEVTLYEQNPVIAALLKDALRRARKHPVLKDIASRMKLVEGDSVSCMEKLMDPVDVIYLDPMFPKRQKSGLINKKLQLIQKLEPPCSEEKDLFDAAIKAGPSRIIVKRPLKSVCLDGREPSYILKGKAIRFFGISVTDSVYACCFAYQKYLHIMEALYILFTEKRRYDRRNCRTQKYNLPNNLK